MKLNPLENMLSRITDLLSSPVPVEMMSPVHRSSVKFRLDSGCNRSRIVSPPAVNNTPPVYSSDDQRFISTKSLNLHPATPQSAKSSTLSPPLKNSHLPSGTATVPSPASSKRRASQDAAVPVSKPQRYQSTDAFVLTTPDITAPPDVISSTSVSRVSSRRPDEKCIAEDWQRIVAAASSDQINLVSFHDSADTASFNLHPSSSDPLSYASSTVPRQSSVHKTAGSGTVIFTLQASPPVKGRAAGITLRSIQDVCVSTSPDSSPVVSKPLSFANPVYSHGAKVERSQRAKAAVADMKSSSVGACSQSGWREVTSKRPQVLPLASAGVGVGRSRQYRDLAGSTESLDSVLASRPAVKQHRGPIVPSLNVMSLISQSTSRIDRHPPPVIPCRMPHHSVDTSPSILAGRGIDTRETNFGALKRHWQSIELPTSPSTSTSSAKSYQSPARGTLSRVMRQVPGRHMHWKSFDTGLSDFSSDKLARQSGSCDNLLTGAGTPQSHPLNRSVVDVDDQSEVQTG